MKLKVNLTLKIKQMKKLFRIVLVSSLSLLCFSCYYDELIERPIDIPEIPDLPENISYSTEVQPIFTTNCISCHSSSLSPDLRAGYSYDALVPDYVIAGDPEASKLFQNLPGIGHPIDVGFVLGAEDIAYIYAWIDQGAKNN